MIFGVWRGVTIRFAGLISPWRMPRIAPDGKLSVKGLSVRRGLRLVLVLLIVSSCALAQTQADRVSAIAQALESRDFDKALELLRPTLQQFPGNAQLWAMQGTAYAGQGHKQKPS